MTQNIYRSFSDGNVAQLRHIMEYHEQEQRVDESEQLFEESHPAVVELLNALQDFGNFAVPKYMNDVLNFFCTNLREEVAQEVLDEMRELTEAIKLGRSTSGPEFLAAIGNVIIFIGNVVVSVTATDEDEEGDEKGDGEGREEAADKEAGDASPGKE